MTDYILCVTVINRLSRLFINKKPHCFSRVLAFIIDEGAILSFIKLFIGKHIQFNSFDSRLVGNGFNFNIRLNVDAFCPNFKYKVLINRYCTFVWDENF